MDADTLAAAFAARGLPAPTLLAETGSTNADARALAERGAPVGAAVIARVQTHGRGRLGRSWWSSPEGALALSVVLRPRVPVARRARSRRSRRPHKTAEQKVLALTARNRYAVRAGRCTAPLGTVDPNLGRKRPAGAPMRAPTPLALGHSLVLAGLTLGGMFAPDVAMAGVYVVNAR
jgi:hypothetical protein